MIEQEQGKVEGNLGGASGKREKFLEKLKTADEKEAGHTNADLEAIVKRNKERVMGSEAALERAKEKIATTVPVAKKDEEKTEEEKRNQKEDIKIHAEDLARITNPDEQVAKIIEIASKKDPFFAVKVAKHLNSNYIMDKVHDHLNESEVREALVKKGLLEEL